MNLLFVSSAYSQYSKKLVTIETDISEGNYAKAATELKKISQNSLSVPDRAFYNYLIGCNHKKTNKEDKAYRFFIEAKKQYLAIDSIDMAMRINLDILNVISAQENNTNDYIKYLNEYTAYALKTKDPVKISKAYSETGNSKLESGKYRESLDYLKKAIAALKTTGRRDIESRINTNIAAVYSEYLNKPDSALYYLKKDIDYLEKSGNVTDLCYNYVNQAASHYYLKDYKKAIQYLKMAERLPLKEYKGKMHQYIAEFLYKNYEALGDYTNAYRYLQLTQNLADSINAEKQNIAINDIQTKYRTKEKELENITLKNKIQTNRFLLYTLAGLFLAGSIIGLLIVKNAKRKEKIADQDKLIEQQKLEKALKDYELNSIDMMLEGQEKERQRIANDLHDNLGSMLATLKLNFENLKLRKNEIRDDENKLYERTDELIEEAYQKVRRLAHAKNAGVFASEGLIPAINKLAEKISIPGKLELQVVPFGFSERLENTLEIAIFRAIQELATNIIKHSQATEGTIHLTHHEDNINIIIEDNGVGFDSSKLKLADGMGLQSIEKKIRQLGGTFTIDATPNKGTTILIDIPV